MSGTCNCVQLSISPTSKRIDPLIEKTILLAKKMEAHKISVHNTKGVYTIDNTES